MWPPKPEVLIFPTVWQISLQFRQQTWGSPRAKKLNPVDCDDDRQPAIAIWTFCSPILQFLAVDRCCNHLANLLSSSTSSKIPNLALEVRRYLLEFQRCNYFRFWWPRRYFRLSIAVVLNGQHYSIPVHQCWVIKLSN